MRARTGGARRLPAWRAGVTMGVYHLIFLCAFLLYLPVLAWRMLLNPGYRRGILQRTGLVPRSAPGRRVVWIHGVSVGEVKAAGNLIERLREEFPDLDLVISATTPTGHALATRLHSDLRVIFYPLDFGWFPRLALDRVRPVCVLLMELEVWPNFLQAAARRSIPVVVVNGRMSERSFRGYQRVSAVFLPQFDQIAKFCVQDAAYRRRLLALDVDADRIFVTGNIKYDSVMLKVPTSASAELRSWLSPDGRMVLVGGSTHGDEEVGVAKVARNVARRLGAPLRLVLAPRHPERAASVREALSAAGLHCRPWSTEPPERRPLADDEIVLVDTIGVLETFYGAGDVAFVGGSMVPRGGQNMLEPAALGKAVVFGPHVANFRNDVRLLLGDEAAIQVRDWDDLTERLMELLSDPERRRVLGDRAVSLIRRNQGATERTLGILRPLLFG